MGRLPLLLLTECALFWAIFAVRPAAAHADDSTPQLVEAAAGPFTVSAWTYPAPVRPGAVHFTVLVTEGGRPLANTAVFITAAPEPHHGIRSAPVSGQAMAGQDPANMALHEVNLQLTEIGRHRIAIRVVDPAGRQGEVGFELEVVSATALKIVISLLAIQAAVVAVWLAREGPTTWRRRPSPLMASRPEGAADSTPGR
jgi:hypothetical protein